MDGPLADASTRQFYAINEPANSTLLTPLKAQYHKFLGSVIPTIRKPGAEIWVTFNPELETDDTYQRFVVHSPPSAVVVKTSYRDNPHLSEEVRVEIEHLKATISASHA